MIDHLIESKKLVAASIPTEQADAIVRLVAKSEDGALTRDYLDYKLDFVRLTLEAKIITALEPIKTDIAVLKESVTSIKWGIGFLFAGILALGGGMASLMVKAFFP